MTSEVGSFKQRAFHQFRSLCSTDSLISNTENDVTNQYYKHGLYSDIFLALKKSSAVESTLDDPMVDDLMDQNFVQVMCALGETSIDLIGLSKSC
jgi:hypothetical protein